MTRQTIQRTVSAARFAHRSAWMLAACAALAACGGGGGGSDPEPPPPPPAPAPTPVQPAVKLEGVVVIDQAVSNATVCLDLNQNAQCDAGEPVSSVTGADGRYAIHYQPADAAATAAAAKALVVAQISAQSVDAAMPSISVANKPFVLTAPAGTSAQINPLTTLVQHGIQGGMTQAEAESAVAQQLLADVASLYDYQAESRNAATGLPGDVRASARTTAFMLELGVSPVVARAAATPVAASNVSFVEYTNADNYSYRTRSSDGVRHAGGVLHQFESRTGKSGGKVVGNAELFRSLTLTSKGWTRCDNTVARIVTEGIPGRTVVCNDSSRYVGFTQSFKDIGDLPMAEVAAYIQKGDEALLARGLRADSTLVINPALLGNARFPAGSVLRVGVSVQNDSPPPFINNAVADRFGYPSIAQMIKARPVGGVNLASAGQTTVGGMGLFDENHLLRVAFVDDKTAQFYACKSTAPDYADLGVCEAQSQSAFTVQTQNGVPILAFENFPGARAQNGVTRGFTEHDGVVYPYRKPAAFRGVVDALTQNARLNDVAWGALKTQLKID